jgi:hypothetical protein
MSIEVSSHFLSVMVLAKSLNYQWFSKMFKNIFMTILWNFRTCIICPGLLSPLPTSLLSWFCGKVKKSSHFICKHFSTSYVFTLTYCDMLIIFFTCHYFTTHQPTQTFTFSSINYFWVLHYIYIYIYIYIEGLKTQEYICITLHNCVQSKNLKLSSKHIIIVSFNGNVI